jgi:hypothetical protein
MFSAECVINEQYKECEVSERQGQRMEGKGKRGDGEKRKERERDRETHRR